MTKNHDYETERHIAAINNNNKKKFLDKID